MRWAIVRQSYRYLLRKESLEDRCRYLVIRTEAAVGSVRDSATRQILWSRLHRACPALVSCPRAYAPVSKLGWRCYTDDSEVAIYFLFNVISLETLLVIYNVNKIQPKWVSLLYFQANSNEYFKCLCNEFLYLKIDNYNYYSKHNTWKWIKIYMTYTINFYHFCYIYKIISRFVGGH